MTTTTSTTGGGGDDVGMDGRRKRESLGQLCIQAGVRGVHSVLMSTVYYILCSGLKVASCAVEAPSCISRVPVGVTAALMRLGGGRVVVGGGGTKPRLWI